MVLIMDIHPKPEDGIAEFNRKEMLRAQYNLIMLWWLLPRRVQDLLDKSIPPFKDFDKIYGYTQFEDDK